MKKIRIGNDIPIKWTINRDRQPEDFSGKTIKLLMRTMSEEVEITDYKIEGNVISWTFFGKDQTKATAYTFTLIENEGQEGMFTIDACRVLQLVECSDQADDDDSDMNVEETTDGISGEVTADSEIQIPAGGEHTTPIESDTVVIDGEGLLWTEKSDNDWALSYENAKKILEAIKAKKRIVINKEDRYGGGRSATVIATHIMDDSQYFFAYFVENRFIYMCVQFMGDDGTLISIAPRDYVLPWLG